MQVTSVDVREIALTRKASFVSSRATTHERRIILVTVRDANGLEGWGECSAPEEPRYNEEWTTSAWYFINDVLMPSLLAREHQDTRALHELLACFRGNRMAKAAVEEAFYDLEARKHGVALWEFLGGTDDPIPCGVSIGIAQSIDAVLSAIVRELEAGYRRIKLKIQPGWDVEVVEAVRLRFPHIALMVDANGAYAADDLNTLTVLDQYDLLMIEQPFAPDDWLANQQAQECLRTPICLDESILSAVDMAAAIELRLCRALNLKLGRVGGHDESRRIIRLCSLQDVACWCGGLHEAGIGRAHNLAMAASMARDVPAELSASGRYWEEDIIVPEMTVTRDGYIRPPNAPGIGFEINYDLIGKCTLRRSTHDFV